MTGLAQQGRREISALFVYIREMKSVSKSIEDTQKFAKELLGRISPKDEASVIALNGDLGSGKTTLTQEIGRLLGINEHIQSPTFVIEKIYELKDQIFTHLIHIDAYRLKNEEELLSLGWEKIVKDNRNLIVVEWAERVKNILPKSAIHIVLTHQDENVRHLEIL